MSWNNLPNTIALPPKPQVPMPAVALALPPRPYLPWRNWRPREQEQSFLSNYNDPYEINSVADVLLNTEGLRRQNYLGLAKWGHLYDSALSRPLGAADLIYNRFIKPVSKGKFGEAGLNLLMNLGETLDVVANPVKGLLMEGNDGFVKGLGLYPDAGRPNYDWDTGNLATDIILEVISDPVNWVTLGSALLASSATKAAVSTTAQVATTFAQQGAKVAASAVDDTVYKKLIKHATTIFRTSAKDITWQQALTLAAKKMPKFSFTQAFVDAVADSSIEVINLSLLKSTQTMYKVTEATQKTLQKATLNSSYGMVWWAAKRGYDAVSQYQQNALEKIYKKYTNVYKTFKMSSIDDLIKELDKTQGSNLKELERIGLTSKISRDVVYESLNKDLHLFKKLLAENIDKPGEAYLALEVFCRAHHEMSLQDYIHTVARLNKMADGAFADIQIAFTDHVDLLTDLIKTARAKITLEKVTAGGRHINTVFEELSPASTGRLGRRIHQIVDRYNDLPSKYNIVDMRPIREAFEKIQNRLMKATTKTRGQVAWTTRLEFGQLRVQYSEALKKARLPEEAYLELKEELTRLFSRAERLSDQYLRQAAVTDINLMKLYNSYSTVIVRINSRYEDIIQRQITQGFRETINNVKTLRTQVEDTIGLFENIPGKYTDDFFKAVESYRAVTADFFNNFETMVKDALKDGKAIPNAERANDALSNLLNAFNSELYKIQKAYADSDPTKRLKMGPTGRLTTGQRKLKEVIAKGATSSLKRYRDMLADTKQFPAKARVPDVTKQKIVAVKMKLLRHFGMTGALKDADITEVIATWYSAVRQIPEQETFTVPVGLKEIKYEDIFAEELADVKRKSYYSKKIIDFMTNPDTTPEDVFRFKWEKELADPNLKSRFEDIVKEQKKLYAQGEEIFNERYYRAQAKADAERLGITYSEAGFVSLFSEFFALGTQQYTSFYLVFEQLKSALNRASRENLHARQVFDPLLDILNEIPPGIVEPAMIRYRAHEVVYKFKLAQLYNSLSFYMRTVGEGKNNPMTYLKNELLDPNTKMGQVFFNLRQHPDTRDYAERIYGHLLSYKNYLEMVENIIALSSLSNDESVQLAVLDSLQNFARISLTTMDQDFDIKMWDLFQTATRNVNARKQSKFLKLEQYILNGYNPNLNEEKVMLEKGIYRPHLAEDDVKMLRALYTKGLEVDINDPSKVYVFMDLETVDLNNATGGILDIAWGEGMGDVRVLTAQTDLWPSEMSMEMLTDPTLKMSAYDQFRNKYKNKDLPSEKEIIIRFLKRIQELQAPTITREFRTEGFEKLYKLGKVSFEQATREVRTEKKVVLVAHNGMGFDFNMLKRRVEGIAARDPEMLAFYDTMEYRQMWAKIETQDTFKMLQEKENFFEFSPSEKTIYTNIIRQYVRNQVDNITDAAERLFIQPVTGSVADDLNAFADIVMRHYPEFAPQLREAGSFIFGSLADIKKANRQGYNHHHLAKSIFASETNYMNVTKHITEGVEGLPMLGVAKVIDFDLIEEYFDISQLIQGPLEELPFVTAKFYTQQAKVFEKSLMSLKNIDYLKPHEDTIQLALRTIQYHSRDAKLMAALRVDKPSLAQNWVMLEHIWRWHKNNHLSLKVLDGVPGFEALKPFLTDPSVAKALRTRLEPTVMPLIEAAWGTKPLSFSLMRDNPEIFFIELEQMIKESIDPLVDYCKFLETDQRYVASNQKIMTALSAPIALYRYLKNNVQGTPYEALLDYGNIIKERQVYQLATLTPDEMVQHLYHNAMGFIRIGLDGYADPDMIKKVYTNFVENAKRFEEKGIAIIPFENHMYITLERLPKEISTKGLPDKYITPDKYIVPEINIDELSPVLRRKELFDHMKATRAQMQFLSDGASNGTFGDYMNREAYIELYNVLPPEVLNRIDPHYRNTLLNTEEFFLRDVHFNHTNIGPTAHRRALHAYTSSDIVRTYMKSSQLLATHAKAELGYLNFYFENGLGINTSPLFNQLPADGLLQIMRGSPEFRLVALIADAKTERGYRVISIKPTNAKSIELARKLDATIVSGQTYSKMVEVINKRKFGSSLLHLWHNLLFMYKVGYLGLNAGTPFRNVVDGVVKNMNSAYDQGAAPQAMLKSYGAAFDLYIKYHKAVDGILELSTAGKYGMGIYEEFIDIYFAQADAVMTKDQFFLVYNFIKDGPSAGQIEALIKLQKETALRRGLIKPSDKIHEQLWGQFLELSNKVMRPNIEVEQINRLSQYLMLLENGASHTSAYHIIAKTHFDYTLKSKFDLMAELVIPFYTFRARNIEYWIDMYTRNPFLMPMYRDLLMPVWRFDKHDHEELSRNRSLQYQILSGALPISESGLTLKLSPSFIDAFQIMTDPVGGFRAGVAPPIKFAMDVAEDWDNTQNWWNLIPYVNAVLTRYKSTQSKLGDTTFNYAGDVVIALGNVISASFNGGRWTTEDIEEIGGIHSYMQELLSASTITDKDILILLGSLIGMTRRWREKNKVIRRPQKKRRFRRAWARRGRARKYYPRKQQRSRNKRIYGKKTWSNFRYRKQRVPKVYYRPIRVNNFYRDIYSPTGKSRFRARMMPVTSQTLKYRIKDFARYF